MKLLSCAVVNVLLHFPMTGTIARRHRQGSIDPNDNVRSSLPNPMAPPSEEFCESNVLGDDAYSSLFVPCQFTFFGTDDVAPDHFSCDGLRDASAIASESRKVVMWPDSCVAAGPRCYSLSEHPDLSNFTLFEGTDYAMEFPPNASVVSVDCASDFAKAQEFLENLPEELGDVARGMFFIGSIFLVAVIASIVACICCCCRSSRRTPVYTPIPPVPATRVDEGPAYKAVV